MKSVEACGLVAAERDTTVPALLQSIAFAPAFTYDAVQRSLHSDIFSFVCFVLGSVGCDSILQRQMAMVVTNKVRVRSSFMLKYSLPMTCFTAKIYNHQHDHRFVP